MIYYEFIDALRKIERSRDEQLLSKIISADIELYTDMRYRFSIHIVNIITRMIDKIYDGKMQVLFSKLYKDDEFSFLIMELRKELDYAYMLTKIKAIPSECLDDIINVYDTICDKYNKFIIDGLISVYGEEYASIYESIMNKKEG